MIKVLPLRWEMIKFVLNYQVETDPTRSSNFCLHEKDVCGDELNFDISIQGDGGVFREKLCCDIALRMAMACQIENQELRAQIGELRKQTTTSAWTLRLVEFFFGGLFR